jgi:ligand-binding sensor domain-containing protein/signal transduction histidine kinase
MKISIAIGLAFLLTIPRSFGQADEYSFFKLDIRDGLSNNQVNVMYKDRKGFLWFGTASGLSRYDGYTCKVFRHNDLDSSSLPDDNVEQIFGGPDGKLWVNTHSGISIYDPVTERFVLHPERVFAAAHLPSGGRVFYNAITTVLRSGETYFIVYADCGVYRWEGGKEAVCIQRAIGSGAMSNGGGATVSNSIVAAQFDSRGNIWLVHADGLLDKFDTARSAVVYSSAALQRENGRKRVGYYLYIDRQDELWLYARGILSGLYQYGSGDHTLRHFSKDSGALRLSTNAVNDVVQDNRGLIWIATDQGGVNLLDKQKLKMDYLSSTEEAGSIVQNSIVSLYKDDFGIIWLGSFKKGVCYYHANASRFPLIHHRRDKVESRLYDKAGRRSDKPESQSDRSTSLPYDDVDRFAEDVNGILWIGTNGGGLIRWDRRGNTFQSYRHNAGDANSPGADVIVGLTVDRRGKLWIGYYQGGLDCFDGRRFIHYRHNGADSGSLADDRVNCITADTEGRLWIGTMGGLDRLDPGRTSDKLDPERMGDRLDPGRTSDRSDPGKTGFYHYRPLAPNSVKTSYISCVRELANGDIWIGTAYGVDVLRKRTGTFDYFVHDSTRSGNDVVNDLLADGFGNVWVATRHGLNVMMPEKDTFRVFTVRDGLPDNTILNILADDGGNLWVSTPSGISKVMVARRKGDITIQCFNYDEYDGLQGREFNQYAALKTRGGELIFGGASGFNLFNPIRIGQETQSPPVVLTGFQLFGKDVVVGEKWKGNVVLSRSISETAGIELAYDENDLSLEFAALNYINAKKDRYAYRLEGFDTNWIQADGRNRRAIYMNLPPGEYVFRVKALNSTGKWDENGAVLAVVVRPPLWLSSGAYLLYILVLAVLIRGVWLFFRNRALMRAVLIREKEEAQRLHELDGVKIKFLTNVSHEFRTPLSMILEPAGKIEKEVNDPASKEQLNLIGRNAKRLLHLVNQLLDLRKIEGDELYLNRTKGDIAGFIRQTAYSFINLAGDSQIGFAYESEVEHLIVLFDHEKIERIVYNLLSSAFKFTPEGGRVSVGLRITERSEEGVVLELTVKDTGIGMMPEIGLAVTQKFVEMHGGSLRVESEPDIDKLLQQEGWRRIIFVVLAARF